MQKVKCNRQGFTLVEMMLVVVVISVLAAMVVPRLLGRGEQARQEAARADIEANLSSALDLYEVDTGTLPKTGEGLEALLSSPTDAKVARRWKGPYLKKKPLDPWGNEYVYRFPGKRGGKTYDLLSYGPDGEEGGEDDIANWENS